MEYCFFVEILARNYRLGRETLASGRTLIGRSVRSCTVIVPDQRVSRVHLQVNYHPDSGVTVQDLYSANGTLLEGRPLYPGCAMQWLRDQVVSIGGSQLVLRYGSRDS